MKEYSDRSTYFLLYVNNCKMVWTFDHILMCSFLTTRQSAIFGILKSLYWSTVNIMHILQWRKVTSQSRAASLWRAARYAVRKCWCQSQHWILCVNMEFTVSRWGIEKKNIQLTHLGSWVPDGQLVWIMSEEAATALMMDMWKVYLLTCSFLWFSHEGSLETVIKPLVGVPQPFSLKWDKTSIPNLIFLRPIPFSTDLVTPLFSIYFKNPCNFELWIICDYFPIRSGYISSQSTTSSSVSSTVWHSHSPLLGIFVYLPRDYHT